MPLNPDQTTIHLQKDMPLSLLYQILLFPDFQQSSSRQEPEKPVQIIVYPGADGEFVLYEDEGNNYNFENGAYATTRFQWKDAAGQLVNGRREGSFPGMREAVYETVTIK